MKVALILIGVSCAWAGEVTLTIAGLRVTPERWDKPANLAKLERYVREAAAKNADLVLTPEGFLEGYVGNAGAGPGLTREKYLAIGEPIDGPSINRVRGLARELKIHLGIGFAERRGDLMFNSFAVFAPSGEPVLRYSKAHNDDDEPYNTTGREFPVAATPLGRWGALICYDRQLPETARITIDGRIGKGAIRSRKPDLYRELLK